MVPEKRKYNNQPNIITNSREELSLLEKRIFYLLINQFHMNYNSLPEPNHYYSIRAKDLGSNTKQIKDALCKLRSRGRVIYDNDNRSKVITPFPVFDYDKNDGIINIQVNPEALEIFTHLKKGYTKYQLNAALSLSSVYSQKIYELLSHWKDKGTKIYLLSELQFTLNANHYGYSKFKQNCLSVAHEEINKKTDLNYTWTTIKSGRAVTSIVFNIKKQVETEQDINKTYVKEEMNALFEMAPADIAYQAQNLLRNYTFTKKQNLEFMSDSEKFRKFAELDSKIVNGVIQNVKNPTRYIASILFKNQ